MTRTRASALLALFTAPLFAQTAAAAPQPSPLSQVAERPPPELGPEEKQVLEQEQLEEEWLEQNPYVPGQDGKARPPAKLAPSQQTGAKQAPSGAHPETAPEARKRTQTLREVSGVILGMKVVEVRGAGDENVVALIKTDRGDRRLAIDLGPLTQLDRSDLHVGGRISAEGYVVAVRDQQFLVATRIKPERGAIVNVVRPSQARLHRSRGNAKVPPASGAPTRAPDQGQPPPLPPPDTLQREPLPPPQITQPPPEGTSAPRTQPPQNKPKSLIEQQQRPGGD